MSDPKISLINYINTPPDPTITNMLVITDSGANIHLARQSNPTIDPVIMENEMKSILSHGSTIDSTNIATLQLTSLSKQARQIHILPKTQTAPLISLVVICDYGCTITLDKKIPSIIMEKK